MANIGAFIEKEASYRRQFNAKNENLSELDRMNNLNTRFMNFLDLVKCETKRSEYLQASLFDKKQEIVVNLRENHSKYQEDLLLTKKYLNDLTYSLNSVQVNERSNRIKIEWFSKLLKFELDNLNLRPKLNIVCAPPPDASINYQISQILSIQAAAAAVLIMRVASSFFRCQPRRTCPRRRHRSRPCRARRRCPPVGPPIVRKLFRCLPPRPPN